MANNNVAVLNGKNATAVALVLFIFGSRAIQGTFYKSSMCCTTLIERTLVLLVLNTEHENLL